MAAETRAVRSGPSLHSLAVRSRTSILRIALRSQGGHGNGTVATRPIADLEAMPTGWTSSCSAPAFIMRPCSSRRSWGKKRVIYAEGEDERVLRAAQAVVEEGIAPSHPGRPPQRARNPHFSGSALSIRPASILTS